MIWIFPLDVNTNTVSQDVKYRQVYSKTITTTRLTLENILKEGGVFDINTLAPKLSMSTQIDLINYKSSDVASTWNEDNHENFDVLSKFKFPKGIRLKTKIVNISRFTPKIVIE